MKKKILTIVGARPQFIKVMPLALELDKFFNSKIIHTGQHYDYQMSKIFFKELNIPKPSHNLDVGSGPHGAQTAKMIERLEKIFKKYAPAFVIVPGDTNSTLAGTLAAVKLKIPVVHIEAGLRSYVRDMPEEINRVLTDHSSSVLFCPTRNAIKNLEKEGIKKGVFLSGDVMADSIRKAVLAAKKNRTLLKRLGLKKKEYYLLTLHRDFNTDSKKGLVSLIGKLEKSVKKIVFPVHPRTKNALESFGLLKKIKTNKKFLLIPPQGYVDFVTLQICADMIITDSGGVQKEAYMLKVPCLTLRKETEWVETLADKANILVGKYGAKLKNGHLSCSRKCTWKDNVFGRGNNSKRIAETLKRYFC
ncbi:MAG: UDP-N-acetylglucosamine 2-epimerase (non-hydrolyzing) [Candidatus Omnitrophota bacterium]|nr:UDP-N-acetylglucosamine 2-epimerase (non-hydrolyzing) [Candidatus Omnitrophota bacterium]